MASGVRLRWEELRKVFDTRVVIEAMTLTIEASEFLAILGPAGCGKSTLRRMTAKLAAADGGKIVAEPEEFRTGFVFQDAHLLPWRNVLDNAALPLELQGVERQKRHSAAQAVLELVGLR